MSTGTTGDDSHPGSDDVALARSPGFWVIVRDAVLFGVVLAFVGAGVPGAGQGRHGTLVHASRRPRLARREPLVGGGDRGSRCARRRAAARLSRPAQAAGHGRGAQGPAGRALHGAGGGCRLAGVTGGWGEPRARGRTGEDGGRAGNLGLGAAEAQRGRASDEHAQRDGRGVRGPVVISDPGDDPRARDRASKGGTLRGHAGRRSAVRLGRVRGLLPDRRVDVRRDLRAAVVQVRGLAAARGRSPRPRRRRARADHSRRDRRS